ncbi:MAG: AAA family ATPase [Acidimicrobiales bacterium]
MIREAELLLERGESVILDASWAEEDRRQEAREVGLRTHSDVVELHCTAPAAVARERIARRMAAPYNPSDATPEIADHIAAGFESWPNAEVISTNQAVTASVDDAYCRVMLESQQNGCRSEVARVEEARLSRETIGFFVSRITRLSSGELGLEQQ